MWTHKSKHKGQKFLGNYELNRKGKRVFKLKNAKTGREITFKSFHEAKKEGWSK